jgi:putative DNA primase/helicase
MGLFENIHGAKSPDDFARQLTRAALRFYGTPLRAWLEFLTKNRPAVEKALKKSQEDFVSANVPAGASGEVFRAAQRLALIAAAGEFASDAGITGWQTGESTNAAQRCFQSWIDQRGTGGAGDMQAAINQVRRFLEANGSSRFQVIRHPSQAGRDDNPDESQVVRDRAGFRRRNPDNNETEYLVLQETFKSEICAGFDYRRVREAMAGRSFLVREEPHWTVKPRQLPEMPSGTRVYCVRAAILEDAE